MKLPLSVVVVTKNEASNIERCLRSVPFAAETLVLDSGSTDDTLKIAESLGARAQSEAWRGFGAQKKRASELATHDWILSLDADEAVSPGLAQEIQEKFASLDPQKIYEMPRQSFHLGRWIRHGGWYPDRQARLFNRRFAMWNEAPVHEKVEGFKNGVQKETLQNRLEHFVFRDLAHQVETNNRYSGLQAQELLKNGKSFSYAKLIVKPWSKFVECYFLKLGFLDGLPGFIIAVGAAYSVFLRWAKMWEQEK